MGMKAVASRQLLNMLTDQSAAILSGRKQKAGRAIPEDWKIARVDAHASITTGSRNTQDKDDDGEYPFFVRSQEVERIKSYSYDGEAVLTAGDGVGTGKVFHYIMGRFDVHQRVYRISDFSDEMIGRFFFYQFSAGFYERIMSMTAKSSVDSARMEMIGGMEVPLPPPREQCAIAKALSDVDGLLAALEKLIDKKRTIKQAAMQQLLTGNTRLPGFSGAWEQKRLGEIGPFSKGRGIRRDDVSVEGLPCIRYGELYTRYHNYILRVASRIPPSVARTALPIQTGALLFTGSGETAEEIGRCAAYLGTEQAYAGGDIVVLTPFEQNSIYLGHLMNHPTVVAQKARMAQGNAVVHISASNLALVEIELPCTAEQAAIAAVLSDMDKEITTLEERRDKARAIKQGMMQTLLTGRVRLVDPESASGEQSESVAPHREGVES